MADSSGSLRPIRPLNVITRYRTGEADLELSLRIRLPPTWDVKTVLEAIIEPFVQEYDRRHPDDPASAHGPFTRVKVLVWAGPTASGADSFRKESRDHIEDIRSAERPSGASSTRPMPSRLCASVGTTCCGRLWSWSS